MNFYNKIFIFEGYNLDIKGGEASFNYLIRDQSQKADFTEKISFTPIRNSTIPEPLLRSLMQNIMLILGISYWKLYCPKEIIIESNFLTREQANFWNIVYTKGMGEFFYKNKIDFRGLVNFPYIKNLDVKPIIFARKNRALLGIGGGKDSIVAAEMLKQDNKQFDLKIENSQIQREVAKTIGKEPIVIKRKLDFKLFELNKEKGVYNGHIPVSAIYAFLGTMLCIFYDYDSFAVGNEKSANYGNVEYLGEMINHQWSKSEEFEKLFNDYVGKFITPSVKYWSPLRNMSELEVVKEFVKYPKYFKVFSSCNRNFKISPSIALRTNPPRIWCGKCAKCLFVFMLLAAFLPKAQVLDIFEKNLLEDKSLLSLFEELIGKRNFKPFECVGTPEETKEALEKIADKGGFDSSVLIKHYKTL